MLNEIFLEAKVFTNIDLCYNYSLKLLSNQPMVDAMPVKSVKIPEKED